MHIPPGSKGHEKSPDQRGFFRLAVDAAEAGGD
jgi:hypothetical protein